MEVIHRRCAGLDIHQGEIAACVRITPETGAARAQGRRFGTMPAQLRELRDWLLGQGVTHAAMEATGVYWLPIYEELEAAGLDVTLCNAHHVKNVPGRKTDQSDAAWLAQLMASGLLRKSFVPDAETRQVRELTRARVHLVEECGRITNALHRLIERAGLKLCSIVSDLQGISAQAILSAVAAGQTNVKQLAKLAKGSLCGKRAELQAALSVELSHIERKLLSLHIKHLELVTSQLAELDAEIALAVEPWKNQIDLIKTVPGIDTVSASAILAEIGPKAAAFDTPHRLAAWAGLAPGQRESAGKRKRAGTRDGNAYMRRILAQVAMVNARMQKNPSVLTEFFHKKIAHLGYKKALVATAHKAVVRVWVLLRRDVSWAPPPPKPLTRRQKERRIQKALDSLLSAGVIVEPALLSNLRIAAN